MDRAEAKNGAIAWRVEGRSRRSAILCVALLAAFLAPAGAGAEDADAAPAVPLDKLLRLPDSYRANTEALRGGANASEWRSRFTNARGRIDTATSEIDDAKRQLKGLAGDSAQWQAAAPGVASDPSESPLSFNLREKLREQRAALEEAVRELRELEVEANLAGVPEHWRYPEATPTNAEARPR